MGAPQQTSTAPQVQAREGTLVHREPWPQATPAPKDPRECCRFHPRGPLLTGQRPQFPLGR